MSVIPTFGASGQFFDGASQIDAAATDGDRRPMCGVGGQT